MNNEIGGVAIKESVGLKPKIVNKNVNMIITQNVNKTVAEKITHS